jgi:hypothetical protein
MQTSAVSFLLPEPWTHEDAGQDVALVTLAAHLAYVGVPRGRSAGLPASPYLAGSEPPDIFRGGFPCQRQLLSSLTSFCHPLVPPVLSPHPPIALQVASTRARLVRGYQV